MVESMSTSGEEPKDNSVEPKLIRFDWKKALTLGRKETPGFHISEITRSDGVVTEVYEANQGGVYSETTQLWFTDKKGNKYDLKSGLPEGVKLQNFSRDYPHADKEQKQRHFGGSRKHVTFGDLRQEGALLALLHEKGHAIAINKGLHSDNTAEGNPIEAYKKQFPALSLKDIKAKGLNPDDYFRFEYKEMGGILTTTYVPHDTVMETVQYLAQREKIADGFMEREYRALREQGIEMELQSAPNPDDITNIVLIQLATYGFKIPIAFEPVNPELHKASDITHVFTEGKQFTPVNVGVFKRFVDEISEAANTLRDRNLTPQMQAQ